MLSYAYFENRHVHLNFLTDEGHHLPVSFATSLVLKKDQRNIFQQRSCCGNMDIINCIQSAQALNPSTGSNTPKQSPMSSA